MNMFLFETTFDTFRTKNSDFVFVCVSNRGDPDKCDIWGNTPLHHAAANGHMHILSFLVNFGANIFALDNDFHTAMDVAASRDRMDCVRFLDSAVSEQTNKNPKKVAILKKEAEKEAEKHIKLCEKVNKKHQSKMEKRQYGAGHTGSMSEASMASSFSNGGTISNVNENVTELLKVKSGSVRSGVFGTLQKKFGKKDKGTLQRSGGDGNVIFLKQENKANEKPEFVEVFNEQDENTYEEQTEEFDNDGEELGGVKQSIFNRPGLGGLIFMKKMGMDSDDVTTGNNENLGFLIQNQSLEAEEDANDYDDTNDSGVPWNQEDLGLDDDEEEESSPLDVFLSAISLSEFGLAFNKEHLDLEALMLCSDDDLKSIRIQLGPRKKILEAVLHRKNTLKCPGTIKDSCL